VNATSRILQMVRAADFKGLSEVEVFSTKYWAMNQEQFLQKVIQSTANL
jgi:hypothetical protein